MVVAVVVFEPVSASGALLDAAQNGTLEENILVMNDGHWSDRPIRVLRAPPPERRRLSSPAETISKRSRSGRCSVNSSRSPSSSRRAEREWPVECAGENGRPDHDRLPIRSSSAAYILLSSSV